MVTWNIPDYLCPCIYDLKNLYVVLSFEYPNHWCWMEICFPINVLGFELNIFGFCSGSVEHINLQLKLKNENQLILPSGSFN